MKKTEKKVYVKHCEAILSQLIERIPKLKNLYATIAVVRFDVDRVLVLRHELNAKETTIYVNDLYANLVEQHPLVFTFLFVHRTLRHYFEEYQILDKSTDPGAWDHDGTFDEELKQDTITDYLRSHGYKVEINAFHGSKFRLPDYCIPEPAD